MVQLFLLHPLSLWFSFGSFINKLWATSFWVVLEFHWFEFRGPQVLQISPLLPLVELRIGVHQGACVLLLSPLWKQVFTVTAPACIQATLPHLKVSNKQVQSGEPSILLSMLSNIFPQTTMVLAQGSHKSCHYILATANPYGQKHTFCLWQKALPMNFGPINLPYMFNNRAKFGPKLTRWYTECQLENLSKITFFRLGTRKIAVLRKWQRVVASLFLHSVFVHDSKT